MRSGYRAALGEILAAASPKKDSLDLSQFELAALPSEIGQLTNLWELYVAENQLTALTPEVRRLIYLQVLDLRANQLRTLPPEIGQLTNLRTLDLRDNQLTTLPPEIGRLTYLRTLDLRDNQLTTLPPEIGQLSRLTALDLRGNPLSRLPPELGNLSETLQLLLDSDWLREPLPELVGRGTPTLFAYLRSLEGAEPQYEAKMLLVGEGNVGKTSLVAALRGEQFVENRPTTHGIELRSLFVPHPRLDKAIKLNMWDFGGQEVYRISHQFFFSRRALYLLVWRPREGQEENAIEDWCRRIRLRVGDDARIIVVATHCDERSPELDYPELKRQFGDLLVGHHSVDNRSGIGIDALREAVAEQAAHLPQMGELIHPRWVASKNEILAGTEPQISSWEFMATCQRHGLQSNETHTLANLLHDLGHIIYYGDDEGLRDIIVLQPEWLTKAIGYVLEDGPTRDAGGVLDHAHLKEIWQGPGDQASPSIRYGGDDPSVAAADRVNLVWRHDRENRVSYPAEYHPYFLRLMEKFDVSYRLPHDAHASLVGQLVPYARPELSWDRNDDQSANRVLSLVWHTADVAPGLIAWLTVRNHRFSVGKHWRRGVFLVHRRYASEALFHLTEERDLTLEVRAPSPDYFFSILRDSVDDLIGGRWPGLAYEMLVPCPTLLDDGRRRCRGRFKLRSLERFREQGEHTVLCDECFMRKNVSELLTGYSAPTLPSSPEFDQVSERLGQVAAGVNRLEGYAAETANEIRAILRVVSTEVTDCPTLFSLVPEPRSRARGMAVLWQWWFSLRSGGKARFIADDFRLTLWCAHPGTWHPWPKASYVITRRRSWVVAVAPYALFVSKTLRLVIPIADAVAGVIWSEAELKSVQKQIDLTKTLAERLLPEQSRRHLVRIDGGTELAPAQGEGLRALRRLLLEVLDLNREFGGLRRVRTPSGDLLWVCSEHYSEYDPGLPVLPR